MKDEQGRLLPHHEEAEKCVLGAALISSAAVDAVVQILGQCEDFYSLSHQHIFQSILNLAQRGEPVDYLQVQQELERMTSQGKRDYIGEAGGLEYLQALSVYVDSAANAEYHAGIVRDRALLRRVIQTSSGVLENAYTPGTDPADLLNEAESAFFALGHSTERKDLIALSSLMHATMEHLDSSEEHELLGVPTGFNYMDELTSGFQPSDMIILAARPSMGKTALALNFALNAAERGNGILFFSLEMSADQLAYRLISRLSGVEGKRIRTKKLYGAEWGRVQEAVIRLTDHPIFIDETPGLSVAEMRSKARRAVSQHGIKMIVLDYLQLMQIPKSDNHQLGVALVSKSIKALAKELSVPIVALSQLSRMVEQRGGDKRPMLSDLRDSGAIEQDADLVVFVYRPEMYSATDSEGNSNEGRAEVIIGKHRNGPTGIVNLHFDKSSGRFSEVEFHAEEPPAGQGAREEIPPEVRAAGSRFADEDAPF